MEVGVSHALESVTLCGCTILSDGWTNSQSRPLLNFLASTPKGAKFLRAVDTTGKVKDALYVSLLLSEAIQQQGKENVVAVCTDSASVNEAAFNLLQPKYPSITWLRCGAHALNLALSDIGKLPWLSGIFDQAREAIIFITNHHFSLGLLRHYTELERGSHLSLLKPCEWAN